MTGCESVVGPLNIMDNKKAIDLVQKEQATTAQNIWQKQLESLPFQPEVHLNLGLSYEVLKDQEKALMYYEQAYRLSAKESELKFYALFNMAQLKAQLKQIPQALELYQQALKIHPDHYETKVNIELLYQQQQQQQQQDQQKKDGQGQSDQQNEDEQKKQDQDGKGDQDKDDNPESKPDKNYGKSKKYEPRPFDGKELSQGDVNKILSELKQQEQKIRANFNRKKVKEERREKDW